MLQSEQQFQFPGLSKGTHLLTSHVDCCEIQIGHTVKYIGKNWNGPKHGSIGTICGKRISAATVQLLSGVKWTIPYSMLAKYDESEFQPITSVAQIHKFDSQSINNIK